MRIRPWVRGLIATAAPLAALALSGSAAATETNYDETMPLVWAIFIISAAGAALVFGVLAYALVRFRDPATKGRRYG